MATVKLGTDLRPWQKEVLDNQKRFGVLVCHRRSGKTVISLLRLLKSALTTQGLFAYVSPFYRQSKAISWDILKKMVRNIKGTKINESELKVVFPNGSIIRLFGADNPDSLRGLDIKGVVFDEVDQQPSSIYHEIIAPMLIANGGWAQFIGTPKGKAQLYRYLKKYKDHDDGYTLILKASESGLLTPEQIVEAKQESDTEDIFMQEYECSFDAAIKGAYYKKELAACRSEGRIRKALYDPLLQVSTFWDLGISDYMAIGFVQVHGNEIRIVDSHQENGEGFEHYKKLLDGKGYSYDKHYFPHDIKVRELSSGQSRLETVCHMFGEDKVEVLPQLKVMDGIQSARKNFSKMWFDEDKCAFMIECLALYRQKYDEVRGIFLQTPEHDFSSHMADVIRYIAVGFDKLTNTGYSDTDYQEALNDFLG